MKMLSEAPGPSVPTGREDNHFVMEIDVPTQEEGDWQRPRNPWKGPRIIQTTRNGGDWDCTSQWEAFWTEEEWPTVRTSGFAR